jgi:hypothetical protein
LTFIAGLIGFSVARAIGELSQSLGPWSLRALQSWRRAARRMTWFNTGFRQGLRCVAVLRGAIVRCCCDKRAWSAGQYQDGP